MFCRGFPLLLPPAFVAAAAVALLPAAARAQRSGDEGGDEGEDDEDLRRRPEESPKPAAEDLDLDAIEEKDLEQRLLLVPFDAETQESEGVAALLESFLDDALARSPRFTVLGLDEAPKVEDVSASLYYDGCPPGEELGCQFVIGEGAAVDRVVSGRVTAQSGGRYRVVVTILNVPRAEMEFTYALDLAAGEEELLPRTVELALDRLRREELGAPERDAKEREEARRKAVEAAQTEEERRVVARMDLDLKEGELERLERERADRAEAAARVTERDIEEIRSIEGAEREWETLGINERQYLSYRNSRLEWDTWRWRWAGHRFQILLSVQVGFVGGSTALRYYGSYLLSPDLQQVVDSYAWQRVDSGSSVSIGWSGGFGVLRNLDVELGGFWARGNVSYKLVTGATVEDAEGNFVPDPENRPPPDSWLEQSVSVWGGELMLRWFVLTTPAFRPTLGGGFAWVTYPSLYNDPEVPDDDESPPPAVASRFPTFKRLTDFAIQLEPGFTIDFNRWLGAFLRVPVAIGLNPLRVQETQRPEHPVIVDPEEPGAPPFGFVRVVVGVQGRLLGLPVQPKNRFAGDEVLDADR
jgi:hypothetical protein